MGHDHCSRHGRGSVIAARGDDGEVAAAALAHRTERAMGEVFDLRARKTDRDLSGEHRNRRRHGEHRPAEDLVDADGGEIPWAEFTPERGDRRNRRRRHREVVSFSLRRHTVIADVTTD